MKTDPPAASGAVAARSFDDAFARHLRAFGPIGLLAIVGVLAGNYLIKPLSAVLALIWAWRSGTPWRELGLERPESWWRTLVAGIAFGCALKLLMKAVVMPLLGAPPTNQAFQFLVGNTGALPEMIYIVLVSAAFGEEVIFRGYAFERLGKLFGSSAPARIAIVLITSAWFAIEHYAFQGLPGVQQAAIVGLVVGTIFALTRRLWFLIIAHAAFDLTAVAIIYWNLEREVANFIFR